MKDMQELAKKTRLIKHYLRNLNREKLEFLMLNVLTDEQFIMMVHGMVLEFNTHFPLEENNEPRIEEYSDAIESDGTDMVSGRR